VPQVAAANHVRGDILANYMAFRLSLSNINWWGAASNLQVTDPRPWQIARQILLERVDFDRMATEDRAVLSRALDDTEED